jgi:hypothetical protein
MDIPKVLYWNCLMTSPHSERFAYLDSLLEAHQPDIVGITEFNETALDDGLQAIAHKYGYDVDYENAISYENEFEGILVLSLGKTAITRMAPWPEITKKFLGKRWDHRQVVRCEYNGFAVYFGHITHPHEHPRLSARRTIEWKHHRENLENEPLPYAWFADTNTTLARTVKQRLGNVALLEHDKRTWGYRPVRDYALGPVKIRATQKQFSRLLYLDRCAVRPDVKDDVTFTVLPPVSNGIVCPSDHLPILLSPKVASTSKAHSANIKADKGKQT